MDEEYTIQQTKSPMSYHHIIILIFIILYALLLNSNLNGFKKREKKHSFIHWKLS